MTTALNEKDNINTIVSSAIVYDIDNIGSFYNVETGHIKARQCGRAIV